MMFGKFISAIFGGSKQEKSLGIPPLAEYGNTTPVCPYCDLALDKMPGRKKKCPNCKKHMIVRTRPLDQKKILLRDDQQGLHEEQQAIKHGTYGELLARRQEFEDDRARLRARFGGREPSDDDVRWDRCNSGLVEHAKSGTWGLYRNTRFEMASILDNTGKHTEATRTFLEVFYLDQNGSKKGDPETDFLNLQGYPFETEVAFVAPGVVGAILKSAKSASLDTEAISILFVEAATAAQKSLKLRCSVDDCLNLLEVELRISGKPKIRRT